MGFYRNLSHKGSLDLFYRAYKIALKICTFVNL